MQGRNQGQVPFQYGYHGGATYTQQQQPIAYSAGPRQVQRQQQQYHQMPQQSVAYNRPVVPGQPQYYGSPQQPMPRPSMPSPYQPVQQVYRPTQYAQPPVQNVPQRQQVVYRQAPQAAYSMRAMPAYGAQWASGLGYQSQPTVQSSAARYMEQRGAMARGNASAYPSQYESYQRRSYGSPEREKERKSDDYSTSDRSSESSRTSDYSDDRQSYPDEEREYRKREYRAPPATTREPPIQHEYGSSDGDYSRKRTKEPLDEEWGGIRERDPDIYHGSRREYEPEADYPQAVSQRSPVKRRKVDYNDTSSPQYRGDHFSYEEGQRRNESNSDGVYYISSGARSVRGRRRQAAEEEYDRAAEEQRLAKEDALDNEITSRILRNTRKQLRKTRQTVLEVGTDIMCARLYRDEARHVGSLVRSVWDSNTPP